MPSTGQGTDLASIVGANIRQARTERGLLLRELAQLVSETTSVQQLSDWERGSYRPSDGNLLRLANALGQEFAWFFVKHDDEPEPEPVVKAA